jgi:hypothetical protein
VHVNIDGITPHLKTNNPGFFFSFSQRHCLKTSIAVRMTTRL